MAEIWYSAGKAVSNGDYGSDRVEVGAKLILSDKLGKAAREKAFEDLRTEVEMRLEKVAPKDRRPSEGRESGPPVDMAAWGQLPPDQA